MKETDLVLEPIMRSSTRPREAFADAVRLLWSRRRFLLGVVVKLALLSAIVSVCLPPRYEATTRLLPAPRSPVSEASPLLRPEASALAGLAGLSPVSGEGRFVALLHSRVLADRIIDRFGLMKIYGAKYRHEARTALAKHTIIQEDRKTSVIAISVSDRDPRRAADIADAYSNELQKLNAELNTSGAHMERVFLEARVDEVGKELHAAAERLSEFSTKFSILDSQQQPKSTVDAMLKLQGESVAAQAELKGLEQIYTPYSLKVRTAVAKVAELNRQLGEMRGSRALSEVPADGSFPSIRSLPTLGVTYGELFRKSKLLEAVQLSLTQQLEMAKTEEIKQLPVLRVMDPAEIPEQRVFPRRVLIVLASALSGLLLGMALVLGGKTWGKISPNDPIKALAFDVRQGISRNTFLQWFDIAERRRMIRQRSALLGERK